MNNYIFLLTILFFCGCSNESHVSEKVFIENYENINVQHTMKSVSYIGIKNNKAYLKVSTMSMINRRWSDEIIYINLSELNSDMIKKLNATPTN